MTDRENIIGLFRKTGYERMLPHYSMTPDLQRRFDEYRERTGYTPPPSAFAYIPTSGVLEPRSDEFWKQFYDAPIREGTEFDIYGVAYEPGSADCMHMRHMRHPLEQMTELEELRAYPFPKFNPEPTKQQLEAVAQIHAEGRFALGGMACTLWESAWYTRGMEPLMMDMIAEPELANFILDVFADNAVANAVSNARAGADGILLGDDIGMQHTIMMSEELFRTYLKPRLARVISAAKAVKPDLIFIFHSCGYIVPFIRDLIEAGVDVLNPVQPECMDFEQLIAEFGDEISFCGTLGTQTLMPFGTPEEVRAKVKENLDRMGPRGGLLACPTHILEPEVPVENVIAYLEACREYQVR